MKSRCRVFLHAAVDRIPAGENLRAERPDHRDGRDGNQTGNDGVFKDFAAGVIVQQTSELCNDRHDLISVGERSHKFSAATQTTTFPVESWALID
jgi:hypothetical protein